jgi:hypothetical protein
VLAAIVSPALSAQSTGSIEGRVTNSVTGEGVSGANVEFRDRKSHVYRTATDSSGSYRLTGLGDGDYQGESAKEGFSSSRGNRFSHVTGFVPVRLDLQLRPWAALRGRVMDEDGKPALGVRVEIDLYPRRSVDPPAVTDENGEFQFDGLPPGSYTVVAKPEAKIRTQDGVRLGTVAIYYPSATELAQAQRILVRTGQNVAGIEIRLKSVPVHRLAGVILDESDKPAAHATVKLLGQADASRRISVLGTVLLGANVTTSGVRRGNAKLEINTTIMPAPEPEVARVESNEDGTFEFAAVEPGDWRLTAEAGVDEDMPLGGVASALISENDLEDIRIRLTPSFRLEVQWQNAQDSASAKHTETHLGLTPVEGQPSTMVKARGTVVPGAMMAGGAGQINNVFPGRYRVMPGIAQPGLHATAVMWGGRDVNGEVVELAPGASPFQVIFSTEFGRVRGKVENGDGATVFLISRESGELVSYRQAECGAGGGFEMAEVAPGDYYAVAFDRTEQSAMSATDFPAAILPIASTTHVEAGATASVNLKLNRWPWSLSVGFP